MQYTSSIYYGHSIFQFTFCGDYDGHTIHLQYVIAFLMIKISKVKIDSHLFLLPVPIHQFFEIATCNGADDTNVVPVGRGRLDSSTLRGMEFDITRLIRMIATDFIISRFSIFLFGESNFVTLDFFFFFLCVLIVRFCYRVICNVVVSWCMLPLLCGICTVKRLLCTSATTRGGRLVC